MFLTGIADAGIHPQMIFFHVSVITLLNYIQMKRRKEYPRDHFHYPIAQTQTIKRRTLKEVRIFSKIASSCFLEDKK